jgi:hypothetical protein
MTTSIPNPRWYRLTPDRLVLLLLVAEALLWLSERLGWPSWHKGYAVLTAVAGVGAAMLLMCLWFASSLLFRWRFQFSIRSLLVLVLVVAIPCSWMSVEMKGARKQREAVEAIRKSGGYVVYDYHVQKPGNSPPGPAWLRGLLGTDFFATALGVGSLFSPATDAGLKHLKGLTQLRWLFLQETQATDADLEHVMGLTQLEALRLCGTQVTDAGLKHLEGLMQLQELDLQGTQVTDAGLEHLKGLTRLQDLDIQHTRVTDEGVKKLQQALPKCNIRRVP